MNLTRAQKTALKNLYRRDRQTAADNAKLLPTGHPYTFPTWDSYRHMRQHVTVQTGGGPYPVAFIAWAGMVIGIEYDGHSHT